MEKFWEASNAAATLKNLLASADLPQDDEAVTDTIYEMLVHLERGNNKLRRCLLKYGLPTKLEEERKLGGPERLTPEKIDMFLKILETIIAMLFTLESEEDKNELEEIASSFRKTYFILEDSRHLFK